jgi:ATP-dependent helicase HepA
LIEILHRGRDRLLEYNSCRTHVANELRDRAIENDVSSLQVDLNNFMENAFDCFGVNTELHSENCLIINPTDHMINRFPGLPDDGMTITYSRDTALSFEDAHYVTWEHPLVAGTLDMVLGNEMGNTAVTVIKYKGVQPGSLLIECLYSLEAAPVEALQTSRYLPPTIIRVVIDEKGHDHDKKLSHDDINVGRTIVDASTAQKIVRAKQDTLKLLINRSRLLADAQIPILLDAAHERSKETLMREINRLKALSLVNPNVRDDEIEFFEQQLALLTQVLDSASLRLDALRVIVVT